MALILLVDDEDLIRRNLTALLQKHGYDVLPFDDGAPALEALGSENVDLILTDLDMPTPGEELIRLGRQRGYSGPAIVMSGSRNVDSAYCDVIEADAALIKPFEDNDLVRLLSTYTD